MNAASTYYEIKSFEIQTHTKKWPKKTSEVFTNEKCYFYVFISLTWFGFIGVRLRSSSCLNNGYGYVMSGDGDLAGINMGKGWSGV